MARTRKLEKQALIKSSPEKLFDVYKNKINLMPKISPDKLRSIQVIEGDGDSVVAKDKIYAVDEENKSITFEIIGGEVTKYFVSYKATIQLVSEGQNSFVKWSVEYEKMNEQVPDPHTQLDFLITMTKEVDNYLVQNP
ncbi:MLP-like protein 423 isoform X2 [Syzygium oleosum]|uniref:MLP-like protein 423 isoform X2 n=1 Tax=Syzygium oleosum TaxID=219896 RepID=UPI0024BBA822|nr:MLP-like protein 423 isoform X2 [Syzygium oleosum]